MFLLPPLLLPLLLPLPLPLPLILILGKAKVSQNNQLIFSLACALSF